MGNFLLRRVSHIISEIKFSGHLIHWAFNYLSGRHAMYDFNYRRATVSHLNYLNYGVDVCVTVKGEHVPTSRGTADIAPDISSQTMANLVSTNLCEKYVN